MMSELFFVYNLPSVRYAQSEDVTGTEDVTVYRKKLCISSWGCK